MSANVHALSTKIQSLSAEQIQEVEDFIDFLRTRGEERSLVRLVTATSAPAFTAIWNNQEDEVYDAL
jgi:uncharacterized protein YaaN involved in tellurite resistance